MNTSIIFGNFSDSINGNETISQKINHQEISPWFIAVMTVEVILLLCVWTLALVCKCKVGVTQSIIVFNPKLQRKFRELIYIPCICRYGLNVRNVEGYNLVIDTDV